MLSKRTFCSHSKLSPKWQDFSLIIWIASLGFCIVVVVLFFTVGQLDNISGNTHPGNSSFLDINRSSGLVFPPLSEFFPQFIVIHTVKGFGIVNKTEIDAFLELSCFFDDPVDVGNLISGSSAFSKTSWNIWKFMVHILLKPDLENFEHYFTSV